ncbi:hypothetical protein GQ55_8G258400 [Panicum hallii var. hallii]|uniref:Uncharacterized protein n=1 Tax=Panicum hallii var. hallii TaxID=1504633 RepID=A0A2T7CRA4_9POAL|nr:hypothetical protein GQ55_8G258400 [Panicum hallii var. hallii]
MASGEAAQPPANRRYPCIHASAATLHRVHFPAAAFPSKRALSLPRRDAAAAAPAVAQVFGSPVARSGEAPWRLWWWRGPGRQPISVTLLLMLLQSESGSARSPAAHRLVSPATRSRSFPPGGWGGGVPWISLLISVTCLSVLTDRPTFCQKWKAQDDSWLESIGPSSILKFT